jgi:hypothetical protein
MSQLAKHWETAFIHVAPTFSGSLSAISSILIIYVILRSETRLSSIYHRIMFGMSIADVLSSTAVALSTLPMPSYMPQEEELEYRWTAGTRLGNTSTCNAQGFFQTFGLVTTIHYNSMLCLYYACAVAFAMKENNIKKYVEPILHGLPIVYGLVPAVSFTVNDMYNPQMGNILPYASWCMPSGYPLNCGDGDGKDACIQGFNTTKVLIISSTITAFQSFFIIVGSLTLVIRRVRRTEKMLQDISRNETMTNIEELMEKHINTKVVLVQALLYIAAYLIGVFPPFLRYIAEQYHASEMISQRLLAATLFLLPLQGFFNFFIFLSYKVYNYRRTNTTESLSQVLRLLFFTSMHEPYFISRISFVWKNEEDAYDDDIAEKQCLDVMTQDEGCDDAMRYRLQIMMSHIPRRNISSTKANDNNVEIIEEGSENGLSNDFTTDVSFPSEVASFPSKSPLSFHSHQDDSVSGESYSYYAENDNEDPAIILSI